MSSSPEYEGADNLWNASQMSEDDQELVRLVMRGILSHAVDEDTDEDTGDSSSADTGSTTKHIQHGAENAELAGFMAYGYDPTPEQAIVDRRDRDARLRRVCGLRRSQTFRIDILPGNPQPWAPWSWGYDIAWEIQERRRGDVLHRVWTWCYDWDWCDTGWEYTWRYTWTRH